MSTSARHNEEFTAPVQLESLLEVPVKLILIEDLIREKSALVHSGCVDISKEKNNNQRLSQSAEGSNSPPHEKDIAEEGSHKKCLFECCATPSRWRNTECYSNKSFFRTVSIPLPCNSLAVIPVMQVEESAVTNTNKSANSTISNANEDTDTDVEMNKESDNEKDARKKLLEEALPFLVSSKNSLPTNTNKSGNDTTKLPSEDVDVDHSTQPKKSNIENVIEQETRSPRNDRQDIDSKSPSLQASELTPSSSSSTTFIGKVTEKPTRYEDLISGHCNNTISSETITSNRQQCQQDVIREEDNNGSEGSSKSADDTLKLTFYNEGRKESTKEFRTGIESGGASSPGSDVRFFESRHGLQMSRVIREVGAASLERIARIEQQHSVIMTESESDGSKDPKNDIAQKNCSVITSKGGDNSSSITENITQTHSQRLISSTDQKNNNSDTNSPTNSNSGIGNNNSNKDNDKTASSPHERPWDGLRISRCQKEIVGEVITLEGESSSHQPSVSDTSHLPYKEKGETENSVERHLQSYLTSLRFVKPTESGNAKNNDHQDGDNAKAKSPVVSPQSRQASTSIISPVISPSTRSPGSLASGGSAIAKDGVVRIPVVQRVSPSSSQQDGSSDCWPERSIARIPTRPYLRRNITYEVNQPQQQQQQHQQSIISQRQNIRGNIPTYQQQQQRVEEDVPISHAPQQASSSEFPLHSPPKRFKSTILPTSQYGNSPMPPSQSHVQQQHHHQNQQTVLNRYPSNVAQSPSQHSDRIGSAGINPNDNPPQQHQHHSDISPSNVSWVRSSGMNYNNMQQQQHYHNNNPRPASAVHFNPATASNVSNKISPPQRSPATATPQPIKYHANAYSQSQQHLEYQRQLQQSLLIASSSLASSSTEPIDSSYEERLRRYTEIYQRQQLDKNKLTEYYDKYHFYPWDILTARDESIIRQMRSQQQSTHSHVPQSPTQQTTHVHQQAASKERMTNSVVQYDTSRRIEIDNPSLQHQQRQFQTRPSNLEHSPARNLTAPSFSPSYASATNVSPPMISPQQSAQHIQTRYSHVQQMQQIQHAQQRGDYVHQQQQQQQQAHNRYYHHSDQTDQNYRHHNQQNPSRVLQSPIGTVPTNRDIQNSPHYRNAYNQLAAAAAAVSSVAAGAAVGATNTQNPLRVSDVRSSTANPSAVPSRDERIAQFLHSRSAGGANKPVIMTVADPVHAPAPPEAVPLSIHRQALEQAIKSNQAGVAHGTVSNLHGMVNRDDGSSHFRHDQRTIPMSPQSHPHYNRQVMSQQSYYDHPHPRNVTIDGRVVTGLGVQSVSNEPLRRVPSPTLAHQTSVIRRIQQQESPPAPARSPFVTAGSVSRHFIESDRPGISFRRISEGSGTDSNGGSGGTSNQATFLYQQQHHKENSVQASASSHYQQLQHHRLNNNFVPRHPSSEVPIQRNMMNIENGQDISRATQKRRIIITDNNGINQNHPERCHEVGSSSTPLIARGRDVPANQVELPGRDEDKGNSLEYDHVVLIDSEFHMPI